MKFTFGVIEEDSGFTFVDRKEGKKVHLISAECIILAFSSGSIFTVCGLGRRL